MKTVIDRLKRAYAALIGKEVITIVPKGSDIYNLVEKETQSFNNKAIEDKFSKVEHLLHFLATRVEVLTQVQKETKESVVQQSSLFEEVLNATSDMSMDGSSSTRTSLDGDGDEEVVPKKYYLN
ncbi:MAG: hypothetical protein WC761_01885 [Candidatus Paceibacterota bacterium]|jgi:hypothetical protein